MAERCRCGAPADYECSSRKVGPPVGGLHLRQPYVTYFLCASCTKGELTREDPPRGVKALPHHAALLKRQEDEARRALLGEVEEIRLGDWGRRAG